jgi:hypothetical protein
VRRIVPRWAAVAAFGLAGTLVVSGCATRHIGTAMLYNNTRVSSTRLAAEVANLNAAYNVYKHKTKINYTPADMPREVLSWILRFAAEKRVAGQHQITVSKAEAESALALEAKNVEQAGDTLREAAVLNGLPPDMLGQLGIWIRIQIKLDGKLENGKAPTSTTAQAALTAKTNHLVCLAAKSMHIKVNPQYGVYDYTQLEVVAAPTPLSAPSPAPSPTKIQSTPNC